MAGLISKFVALMLPTIKRERQNFPTGVRKETLRKQKGKCKFCKGYLNRYYLDFDHKDGNRGNNRSSNCQALCSNCHSRKTRTQKRRKSLFS